MATILVADDNSNIQKMVGLALKDHGIDVVAVGNGEAAVRRIPDVHPDLILADIFMPVKNGYEVCDFVKKDPKYSHIPVILLVGAFDPLDEREAQRVGADGVLKKPFIPPDPLITMVKSALARAGQSRRPVPEPVPVPQPVLAAVSHSEVVPEQPAPASTGPAAVTFGDTDRPVAFGSMLETETTDEAEAEAYVAPVRHPELSDSRNWGVAPVEEEIEEEEESPSAAWRASSVPDELVAAADETATERSPYADVALGSKEDAVTSTGTFDLKRPETDATPALAEAPPHNFFAENEQTEQSSSPAQQDVAEAQEGVPAAEVEATSPDAAEVSETEPQHENLESQRKPALELEQKQAFERVFTPDAFPGLFVEERPLSPIQLREDSLQDSPSAFAELSASTAESASSSATIETGSAEAAPLPKLPSLWEEQVRQAARLIASAWPGNNPTTAPSEREFAWSESGSPESGSFALKPFSMEPATRETEMSHASDHSHGVAETPQTSDVPSQALENTPEYNSWLTKQGRELLTSSREQGREVREIEKPVSGAFAHEVEDTSTHQTGPLDEISDSGRSVAASAIDTESGLSSERQSEMAAIDESIAAAFSYPEPPAHSASLESDALSESMAEHKPVAELDASSSATELLSDSANHADPAHSAATPTPDLDAVVAKVLARMNPEMFHSMTQQLLKPVIEAIVRSELEKKQ